MFSGDADACRRHGSSCYTPCQAVPLRIALNVCQIISEYYLVIIHKKWTGPVVFRPTKASTISATEKFGRLFLIIRNRYQAAAGWAPCWRLRNRPLRTKVFYSVFACPAGSAPLDWLSSPLPVFHQAVAAPEKIFGFLVGCTSVCHTLRHAGNIFNRAIPH